MQIKLIKDILYSKIFLYKLPHVQMSRFFIRIFIIFCFSQNSYSAFSNYNSILPGDLISGLGGAGAAIIGDISAAAFYNPSTLAWVKGNSFSAAVGIYKKFDTNYNNDEDFTKAALRANLGFFRSLPSSSGSLMKIGDWYCGMSIIVPDYDTYKGDLKSTESEKTSYSFTDESLWVGGAAARRINEYSSWGVTLYYTARNYTSSLNDRSGIDGSADYETYFEEKTITQNGVVPVFGYFARILPTLDIGISARLGVVPIGSAATYLSTDFDSNGGTPVITSVNEESLRAQVVIPAKLTMGFHWQYDPTLKWSIQGDLYEGTTYRDISKEEVSTVVKHNAVFNGSLGFEKIWTPYLKTRFGGFTNFSAHPTPRIDLNREQPDRVDQLGFAANFVLTTRQNISYTFGGYYTGGRGRAIKKINGAFEVISKQQQVFTMLVGTAFSM